MIVNFNKTKGTKQSHILSISMNSRNHRKPSNKTKCFTIENQTNQALLFDEAVKLFLSKFQS